MYHPAFSCLVVESLLKYLDSYTDRKADPSNPLFFSCSDLRPQVFIQLMCRWIALSNIMCFFLVLFRLIGFCNKVYAIAKIRYKNEPFFIFYILKPLLFSSSTRVVFYDAYCECKWSAWTLVPYVTHGNCPLSDRVYSDNKAIGKQWKSEKKVRWEITLGSCVFSRRGIVHAYKILKEINYKSSVLHAFWNYSFGFHFSSWW